MAGCVVSSLAVAAVVAGNMMGNKHAVAHFDFFDFAADFTYNARCFVPQHTRSLRHTVPFKDVTTTDAARHNLEQSFIFSDAWNRNLFDAYVMVVVVEGGKQSNHQKEGVRLCLVLFGCRGLRLLAA